MDNTGAYRATGRVQLFGSMCVLVFLVNLARLIYAPLLEPFRHAFNTTTAAVGLLATLVWIGSALPRFPTGYLLTKFSRPPVVFISGIVLAISSVFAASATSLEMLYAGALLMGLSSGVYFVAANPLVSELFPERVGRVIGIHGVASQIAAVVAPAIVAIVFFIPIWPIASWRVIFLLIGATALLSSLVFAVLASRTALPSASGRDRDFIGAFRSQWRLIATAVALVGFIGLTWNGIFNLYITYLVDIKGFSESISRLLLIIIFATGVPAFWVGGDLADRLPFIPLILVITLAFAGTLFAFTVVHSILGIFLVSALMGFIIHAMFPVTDTYVLSSVGDKHRGSTYAIFSATMMPITATGPFILGISVDSGIAFDVVFQVSAVALVVFVLVFSLLSSGIQFPFSGRE